MKQLAFLVLLLPILSYSQRTFAPINTVWNYEQKSDLDPQTNICSGNHIQYRVEEELIIDGKDCSLIRAYRSTGGNPNFGYTGDSLVVYQDQDKIYFQEDTTFLLLFDFGAQLGDTIVRYDPFKRGLFSAYFYDDSDNAGLVMDMVVTAINTEVVDGDLRNILWLDIELPDGSYFRDRVLDGIGSVSESFSGFFAFTTADGCNGGFLCYKNDSIDYQKWNSNVPHPGCDFIDSVEDELAIDINIFPHPFSSEIHIELELQDYQVRLLDIHGRVILYRANPIRIDTYGLASGMYLLQIVQGGRTYSQKVVKL